MNANQAALLPALRLTAALVPPVCAAQPLPQIGPAQIFQPTTIVPAGKTVSSIGVLSDLKIPLRTFPPSPAADKRHTGSLLGSPWQGEWPFAYAESGGFK